MSPSSVDPLGAFSTAVLLLAGWRVCCRGDQSCLSVRLGYDKGKGPGVGQSTQICPCVGHERWLNGGWWCDSQVLRDIRTDISDGAWHHELLTCLEEGFFFYFRSDKRKWVEGHLTAPLLSALFVSVFYIFYPSRIFYVFEEQQKRRKK